MGKHGSTISENQIMNITRKVLGVVAAAGWTTVVVAQGGAGDYLQWRGANRDGAVAAFNEPRSWPEKLTQRWKVEVGTGYATPLVVGNRIYMFSRKGDN